jgi:peptide subunit release factor 1 (eRF1)
MITREELRHLAQVESAAGCAVSFYFQPQTPQDKSHREEAILVKDLVREALRQADRGRNHQVLRGDLQKILEAAESLYGNHSRGKAIFACSELGIWRELDLPPRLGRSQLKVDSRFHLRPLVAAQAGSVRTCIALVNRLKARILEMNTGELIPGETGSGGTIAAGAGAGEMKEDFRQRPDLEFGPLPKTGRSDGYLGYNAGHRERHAENGIKNHFKLFVESLQMLLSREKYEALLIGCHDDAWPDLEPLLHSDLKKRLAGRFVVDPVSASAEEVRQHAKRILEDRHRSQLESLLRETLGEAQRKGRGALGLRRVLIALERQEVQTLLVSNSFKAAASECAACHHLDTRMVRSCAICGHQTRELPDVTDALVDLALRSGAEIEFCEAEPGLEKAGHVAALLRYRADQNTAAKIAV